MDDYSSYWYNKCKRRVNGFLFICLIGCIFALWFVNKENDLGHYDHLEGENRPLIVLILCIALMVLGLLFYKGLLALSKKSKGWTIAALIFSWPVGLFFYLPMLQYHNGTIPRKYRNLESKEDRKVFKATVRCYQKAWGRQNFFKRVVLPILYLVGIASIYQLIIYGENTLKEDMGWIYLIVAALLVIILLYAVGGVQDVRRTYDYYNVGVRENFFGELESYSYHTKSVTKDETDISWGSLIAIIICLPAILMAALIAIFIFIVITVIKLILPVGGKGTIYIRSRKTMLNPMYMPLADSFLSVVVVFINKILGSVFSFYLVNEEFWLEGIGPEYIEKNISQRNGKYLEKLLEKVENKYGYRYWFK